MRGSELMLVATLAWFAGSAAGSSEPKRVAPGESFELKVGESSQVEGEALVVGFEGVSPDSRCPKGEQCISEGDATVRVSLQKSNNTKETRDLHTSPTQPSAATYLGYEITLLRLDPYPISGRTIKQGDYVATLRVTGGPSAATDP